MSPLAADLNTHATPVRAVSVDRTTDWLVKGWQDFIAAPWIGLFYGGALAAVGYFLVFGASRAGLDFLVLPLTTGFLLVAPLLAVGLYDASRRMERGEPPRLLPTLTAWRANLPQIAAFGLLLVLIMVVWLNLAALIYGLMMGGNAAMNGGGPVYGLLTLPGAIPFLAVGTLVGAALAAFVFAISVISVPMLLDRKVGVLTAVATSVAATRENARVMIGWALAIALLTAAGLALFFVGLAVALPVVGHASWHAYRDLAGGAG